jgi:diguanylate cyclase (GGDEF)-like protein
LDREEGEEDSVRIFTGAPERQDPRAIELSYLYGEEHAAGAVHEALGVPLFGRIGRIGWLGVFSRDPDVRFGDDDVRRLEELAERVAPAIENARRFREARQLADLDSLTGLHNRRYFHETLGREVVRAQRYQRRLSLVIVDVDGFKEINDRIGHLAGDAVLAEIADRIRQVVRSADIPCRVGGDEFAVIVPEVEGGQARQLVGRIQRAVSRGWQTSSRTTAPRACSSAGTSRSTPPSTRAREDSPRPTRSWRPCGRRPTGFGGRGGTP